MGSEIYFQNNLNATNIPLDYTLTRNKKVFSEQTLRTSGPLLWNSLDQTLKMPKTVNQFRNQFKNHLISQYQLFWFGVKIYLLCVCICIFFLSVMPVHYIFLIVSLLYSFLYFLYWGVITSGLMAL